MIYVYKLTEKQAAEWRGGYGANAFEPEVDKNGNRFATQSDADNPAFPFRAELAQCPMIVLEIPENVLPPNQR